MPFGPRAGGRPPHPSAHLSNSDPAHRTDARFFANRPVPAVFGLGVTVEDRRYGLPRIEVLRRVSAPPLPVVEPLLEDLGPLDLDGIGWVLVGGESGRPPARCGKNGLCRCGIGAGSGVAFLFKQWGAWGPDGVRRDKKANGR